MATGESAAEIFAAPSDAELIARVRGGDTDAYGTLFARHVVAARRLARALVRGPDSDDLVSDAFTKTLAVLQGGGGPDEAFRAYLLTAVRRLHVDRIRRTRRVTTTDDLDDLDDGVPFVDPAVAEFEGGAATRAFRSLPERWQLVLWHLEVENDKPADIAPLLDLSPNSVSALAYRAREGLRQAFVTMHHTGDPAQLPAACRVTRDRLGGFVRGALARRESRKVDDHLDGCLPCTGVYLELREVNSSLAGLVGPVVLGGAAAAYLSGLGVGGATAASAAAGSGLVPGGHLVGQAVGRVRDAVAAHAAPAGATVAAGVTALVVAGGAALVVQDRDPAAQAPFSRQLVTEGSTPVSGGGAADPSVTPSRTAAAESTPTAVPSTPAPSARGAAATPAGDPGEDPGEGPGDERGGGASADAGSQPAGTARASRPRTSSRAAAAPRRADLAVTATLTAAAQGQARITVTVSGVPAGQTATLAVRTSAGILTPRSAGCSGEGGSVSCSATSARSSFELGLQADAGTTVDLVVTPPDGWTDPVSTNNSVQLRS